MRWNVLLIFLPLVISIDLKYPTYPFRTKSHWGRRFNSEERLCRTSERCRIENYHSSEEQGLEVIKCIRLCLSPNCYKEIYAWNELELGEIDIRSTSFKGCVVQELRKNASLLSQEL